MPSESHSYASHPPLHPKISPPTRSDPEGNEFFVDPARGDDSADGSRERPWRSLQKSLGKLAPGNTLTLRGGRYREQVYCAVAGTPDHPITIRGCPGETVWLDGGIADFFENPAEAWEPMTDGARDEYRSVRPYRNLRDVLGLFGDSMAGLQTYWHLADLRSDNEEWITAEDGVVASVYCGPGLYYDKVSGHIHVRLAHTNKAPRSEDNYRGETDPRKLPLIVAPFDSTPLFVDQAMHVRFQDFSICGGGYNTTVLQFGIEIEWDHLTIHGGTYCLRARNTGPFRMTNCSLHGQIPPWAYRSENSLYSRYYDPFLHQKDLEDSPARNIARLPTHALMVTEGAEEDRVFAYPFNHHWEVSHCRFTDSHDGVYVAGKEMRFHHNHLDSIQDDAIYTSSPSPMSISENVRIYQNLITRSLMAFGFHSRGGPEGSIYFYRNLIDLRHPVAFGRPGPANPKGDLRALHVFLMHGRSFHGVESIFIYQNTLISPAHPESAFAGRCLCNTSSRTKRRVYNNIFIYLPYQEHAGYPALKTSDSAEVREDGQAASVGAPGAAGPATHDIHCDGNLHWCPVPGVTAPREYLETIQNSPGSRYNREHRNRPWETHSMLADPLFVQFEMDPAATLDCRLQQSSPAVARGVPLPEEFEDPVGEPGTPIDIGAIPLGGEFEATGPRG